MQRRWSIWKITTSTTWTQLSCTTACSHAPPTRQHSTNLHPPWHLLHVAQQHQSLVPRGEELPQECYRIVLDFHCPSNMSFVENCGWRCQRASTVHAFFLRPWDETSWRSCAFIGGKGPIHWRATCAKGLRAGRFWWKGAYARFRGKFAFANAFVCNRVGTRTATSSWPYLPFIGTSSPSWAFVGTSSPSWAHLPFHGHIFHFMDTWSPSQTILTAHVGLGMVC